MRSTPNFRFGDKWSPDTTMIGIIRIYKSMIKPNIDCGTAAAVISLLVLFGEV
jgi:hypothetical protein